MKDTIIYTLSDPRKKDQIRYVGKTTKKNLSTRLVEHLSKAKYKKKYGRSNHRLNWLSKLLKEDIIPVISQIDKTTWDNSSKLERFYIKKYLKDGHKLVNSDDRGEGGKNKIISKETRKKMSIIKKKQYENNEVNINYVKIYQYSTDGIFLKEYNSLNEAAKINNIHVSTIIRCAKGEYKTGKGFIWKYNKTDNVQPASKTDRKTITTFLYEIIDLKTNEITYITSFDFEKLFNKTKSYIFACARKKRKINNRYLIKKTHQKITTDLKKFREFGETPEEDNTEPSLKSNLLKGVTTRDES